MGRDQGSQAEKHFLALATFPITPLKGHPCLSKQMISHSQLLHRQVKLRPVFSTCCSSHLDGEKRETRTEGEERTKCDFQKRNFFQWG